MYDPSPGSDSNDAYGPPSGMDGSFAPAPGPIDNARAFLQQHGKKVLAATVLIVVLGFTYHYFIGSLVKTTIEARDTEGKMIATPRGMLFEGENEKPFKSFNGSITLDLRPGEYRMEWQTDGTPYLNPGSDSFTVSGEEGNEQTHTTVLERDLGVTITSLTFPSTLVAGQTGAQATLTLQNQSEKNQTVELAYDKDAGPGVLDIIPQPAVLTVPAHAGLSVNLSISVPVNAVVKSTKTGDTKTGKIRVKYTNEGKAVSYTLFKSFNLDVNPKTPQTFSAAANKLFSKTFTVKNANAVDAGEAVRMDVTVKGAQANDPIAIASWFTWSPNPISALAKGQSVPVQMQLLAPPTASSDTITGEIRFYTGFWSQVIPFTLNLTEAKVQLDARIDGSETLKSYTLTKDASGNYETKNALLKLDNQSALPIENVLMQIEGCDAYISQVDPNFFLSLKLTEKGKSGSSKTTTLAITAPAGTLPGDTKTCLVQISYLDPKTGDVGQNDPITVQIET